MTSSRFTTAKAIAKKYDLSYQTINRYSDSGLLPVAFKKANVRYFERAPIEKRMSAIIRMAREGYSLLLIRKKLVGI
jgi:DNA-binding transcriptional MerR regulator